MSNSSSGAAADADRPRRAEALAATREALSLLRAGSNNTAAACENLREALQHLEVTAPPVLSAAEHAVLQTLRTWSGPKTPTYREIAHACNLKSHSYARSIVLELEEKGILRRATGKARAIKLLDELPHRVPAVHIDE